VLSWNLSYLVFRELVLGVGIFFESFLLVVGVLCR